MDPITSRRIGNAALILAVVILLWAVCGKLGFVPPLAHVREMYLFALVLVFVARGFRRRADRVPPGVGA
jgi:hypothetical protein